MDIRQVRADVARCMDVAGPASDFFASIHRVVLDMCPAAERERLLVEVAVTHLISLGLVAVVDGEQWEGPLPLDVVEPFFSEIRNRINLGAVEHTVQTRRATRPNRRV